MYGVAIVPGCSEQFEDPLACLPSSHIAEYPKGSTIYGHDEITPRLYLVIEGMVNVSRTSADGRAVLIDICREDDFFGESAFLNQPHRPEEAAAMEDTRLMSWSATALSELILRRPQLAVALLQTMTRRAIHFKERLESFNVDTIPRRLARSLIQFAHRMGTPDATGAVRMKPLTHDLLARYVGTSREMVTSHMNQFRSLGHVEYSRGSLTVYPANLGRWLRGNV